MCSLKAWLDQYKRFDYDASMSVLADSAAKEAGLDLRPFRVRGGDSALHPPSWRYVQPRGRVTRMHA